MRPVYTLVPALAALTLPLAAQTTSQRLDGLLADNAFGRSVASIGDIDGDRRDDFMVGADWVDSNSQNSGTVYVYSGATRTLLFSLDGDSIGDFFGFSVAGAGDVDNDGVPDLIVGAYGDEPPTNLDTGAVYVYSGRTQALIWRFEGSGLESRLGYSVGAAGDVNADGYADIIGGAYSDNTAGFSAGQAVVWSGKDGSVIWTFNGAGAGHYLGFGVNGAGDVDKDGFDDLIVGAVGDGANGFLSGTALVYSGRTGAQLWRFDGQGQDLQGASVASAGDVDGDLHDDVIVGAPFADDAGSDVGSARVYSGRTGALLHTLTNGNVPGLLFGYPVAGAGDVDGDGRGDLLVTALLGTVGVTPVTGGVYVFSGATGNLIESLGLGGIADAFGWGLASAGDVDDDGFDEILVGAPFADFTGVQAGSAYVIDLNAIGTPPKAYEYGIACPGSNGKAPHIGHRGRAAIGETLEITLRGTLPNAPVVVNMGLPMNLALDSYGFTGCTLYASNDGFVIVRTSGPLGVLDFDPLLIPNTPSFVGQSFVAQWICLDPAANVAGYAFSNAAEYTFGN
ncbi:MAG: FG-GAP repeat protein [Planctomycetes bacterium]|nr:FG-GAP repeat protein [Planctomycetota bacterium]